MARIKKTIGALDRAIRVIIIEDETTAAAKRSVFVFSSFFLCRKIDAHDEIGCFKGDKGMVVFAREATVVSPLVKEFKSNERVDAFKSISCTASIFCMQAELSKVFCVFVAGSFLFVGRDGSFHEYYFNIFDLWAFVSSR